jgi:hypothetical protein
MQKVLLQLDATYYTVPEALDLFVPNIVWNEVRRIRHQLLYGGQGTGKTILLKRLSWPAMLNRPAFLESAPFVSFYYDLRDLAILKSTFRKHLQLGEPQALMLARLFASLHLLDSMVNTLIEGAKVSPSSLTECLKDCTLEVARQFAISLGLPLAPSIEELSSAVISRKGEVISALASPTSFRSLEFDAESSVEPEMILRVFSLALKAKRPEQRIGILLDQYEYLPRACRPIFNSLLRRENEPHFFCIAACRPFSFSPELFEGFIQPGEDFHFTAVEYFEGDSESYEDLLSNIWDAIRPEGPRLNRLLEGGPKYFAALSSRSVRRFLELCEATGAMTATHSDFITKRLQRGVAESIAKQSRDQFKASSDVAPGSVWHLILRMSEKAFSSRGLRSLPILAEFKSDDLLGIEYLSEAAQALLRKAFEEGALQFHSRRDASSLSIPERCIVAPILAPVLKAELHDSMVRAQISHGEIEQIAKGGPRIGSGGAVAKNGLSKLFLSISFADLPEPTLARGLFQKIFGELGIKIVEGLGVGSASLDQIKKQLEATDLTLVDLTYLRPNVVFEMGLTLGVSNRLVPLFNKDVLIHPNLEAYPFLADMGHLEYALNPDDIRELREKVLAWADRPLSDAHILAT